MASDARLAAHQQLKRAIGGLELKVLVLKLLDELDGARGGILVELDASIGRLLRLPALAPFVGVTETASAVAA